MKSLSLKLVILYVISVFFISLSILAIVEYRNFRADNSASLFQLEIGPAYLNGATPKDLEKEASDKSQNIHDIFDDYLNGLRPQDIINRFQQVVERPHTPTLIHTAINGPLDYPNLQYNVYLLDISTSRIGPILIEDTYFLDTINSYINQEPFRLLYFTPIQGYQDVVILASFDERYLPGPSLISRIISDIWIVIPLVFLGSIILGILISRRTVAPITRIAHYAEDMSEKHFDQRLTVMSNDEIGSLAKSLNRMAAKLQASFESQKRFISDAAHGLKTPLSSVKVCVTGALDQDKTVDEYKQLLEFISDRVDKQEELINDLLFLARADEGCSKLNTQRIDLSKVASESEETFRYLFEEKGIKFEAGIERDIMLQADSKLMMHLLSNLLENALKNTPTGGTAKLEVGKSEGKATIEISDTGTGIPREYLGHLFERFYKVPGNSSRGNGFGLGLAICKSIVESHDGEIAVKSEVNVGTVFTVKLPLDS